MDLRLMKRARWWLLLGVMVLASCSSSVAAPAATTVTTAPAASSSAATTVASTETTISQEELDRAEIEDVVQRVFAYQLEHDFAEGSPALDKLATNPILDRFVKNRADFADKGYEIGEGDFGVTVIDITFSGNSQEATVDLCRLDEAPLLDSGGNEVSPRTPGAFLNEADFVRVPGEGWRLAEFRFKDDKLTPCEL